MSIAFSVCVGSVAILILFVKETLASSSVLYVYGMSTWVVILLVF